MIFEDVLNMIDLEEKYVSQTLSLEEGVDVVLDRGLLANDLDGIDFQVIPGNEEQIGLLN